VGFIRGGLIGLKLKMAKLICGLAGESEKQERWAPALGLLVNGGGLGAGAEFFA
jgi:hypothetical protein